MQLLTDVAIDSGIFCPLPATFFSTLSFLCFLVPHGLKMGAGPPGVMAVTLAGMRKVT